MFQRKLILILVLILISSCASGKDPELMTPEELDKAMQEEMEKNPPKFMTEEEMQVESQAASSLSDGAVLKSGSFVGKAHDVAGSSQIIEKEGRYYLVLSEDFETDAGPDLHVVLAENPNPQKSKDLHEGQYLDLGSLKSNKGAQTYEIPPDMVDKYSSATIYCKPFKVVFSVAGLEG